MFTLRYYPLTMWYYSRYLSLYINYLFQLPLLRRPREALSVRTLSILVNTLTVDCVFACCSSCMASPAVESDPAPKFRSFSNASRSRRWSASRSTKKRSSKSNKKSNWRNSWTSSQEKREVVHLTSRSIAWLVVHYETSRALSTSRS